MRPRVVLLALCVLAAAGALALRPDKPARGPRVLAGAGPEETRRHHDRAAFPVPADPARPAVAGPAPAAANRPEPAPRIGAPSAAAPAPAEGEALPLAVVAAGHAESLTPLQTAALAQLAEDFLATVDHPASPATPPRDRGRREKSAWERERELNDARYLAQFGQDSFNSMLLRRAEEARAPGAR